jgi:hypothetical protein
MQAYFQEGIICFIIIIDFYINWLHPGPVVQYFEAVVLPNLHEFVILLRAGAN